MAVVAVVDPGVRVREPARLELVVAVVVAERRRRDVAGSERQIEVAHRAGQHGHAAERAQQVAPLFGVVEVLDADAQLRPVEEAEGDGPVRKPLVERRTVAHDVPVPVDHEGVVNRNAESGIGSDDGQMGQHRRHRDIQESGAVPQGAGRAPVLRGPGRGRQGNRQEGDGGRVKQLRASVHHLENLPGMVGPFGGFVSATGRGTPNAPGHSKSSVTEITVGQAWHGTGGRGLHPVRPAERTHPP